MRLATAAPFPGRAAPPRLRVSWVLGFVAVVVVAVVGATRSNSSSILLGIGVAGGLGLVTWMFFTERLEGPLVAFLLYLGLLDGVLKLETNSSVITLGRDALLYVIAVGFLARATLRRRALRFPPLSGWILAFVCVVLIQLFNPANGSILHTLGGLRPQLEFVPLFFVGYGVLQTRARLQTFFLILLVIATANGIAGVIQLNLSPSQFASWGPGYAYRINGTGTGVQKVSGRAFNTSTGQRRTRPFGLGDDAGVGAAWGMLALGGALGLVSLGTRRRNGWLTLLLCVGPPLAIISGEGRALLVCSVIAMFAFVALATTARRLIPTLAALLLGLAVVIGVIAYISSVSGGGVFDRYATVTPSKLVSTTGQERGGSLSAIPKLFVQYPLGGGISLTGPAIGFAGGNISGGGNGETEPGFLLSDLGIPGLVIIYGFMAHLLFLGFTRVKLFEPETRLCLAALLAGIVGLVFYGISSATTATAPASAYLWFAGGALSYWLTTGLRRNKSDLVGAVGRRSFTTWASPRLPPPAPARSPEPVEQPLAETSSSREPLEPDADGDRPGHRRTRHPRVLIITPDFPPARGGIQVLTHRIASAFTELKPTVLTLGHPDAASFDDSQDLEIVRTRRKVGKQSLKIGALNARAVSLALRERPDVVLSAHITTSLAATLLRQRMEIPFAQYVYAKELGAQPELAHFAVTRANRVLAISRYSEELALKVGARASHIALIHPGVDVPPLVRREYRPGGPPTILTVSRLEDEYKGHDVLMRAMPLIRARVPDARWRILGGGSLRPALEASARGFGLYGDAVQFLGSVNDAVRDEELLRADVFCMVSRLPGGDLAGEGFGIVYLEAGAHGLPVVAGAVGGATDAVVHGETGLLVDPEDPVAVADALVALLSDPGRARRMGRAGRAFAERLTWQASAQRVEAELLNLLP